MEQRMTDGKHSLRRERRSHQRWSAIRRRGHLGHGKSLAIAAALAIAAGSLAAAHDASHHAASSSSSTPAPAPQPNDEAAYLAENNAAMKTMMMDMAVKPSGDVDADFVAMMVPHHQGAVDMARAELRYGRNERLRRIAQEIIVQQSQEIGAMHHALGDPPPPPVAAPTQPAPTMPEASTTNPEH
jgi:Domain of unknown function (DUF305)